MLTFTRLLKKVLIRDNTNATNIVIQNDEKAKPAPTIHDVKLNINALMTILNNPKVKIVIGNERRNKIGFIVMFKSANTRLAPSATHTLST